MDFKSNSIIKEQSWLGFCHFVSKSKIIMSKFLKNLITNKNFWIEIFWDNLTNLDLDFISKKYFDELNLICWIDFFQKKNLENKFI